jgi:lipid kinase YegS
MRAIHLILNGKSAARADARAAVQAIRAKGHSVEVRVTWEAGDAARFAREAAQRNVEVVVAGGGDGTVNEVVGALCQIDPECSTALGVLPLGTANDFAHGCGIPCDDLTAALELCASGAARKIDVGVCNGRHFVNVASGGFGAEVTATTPPKMKQALGGAAYSLMGLITALKLTPYRGTLTTSQGKVAGELLLLAVCNGRQAGGGYVVGPQARLDDGLLDVLVVPNVSVDAWGQVLHDLINLGQQPGERVRYLQVPELEIKAERPLYINLDGEPLLDTHFQFHLLPQRLPAVLPYPLGP